MKVIIAGSRSIEDYRLVEKAVERSGYHITEVVCGMAPGVDLLGKDWGDNNGIHVEPFPAKWRREDGTRNLSAGFERNKKMGDYADAAICIWDGESGGTKDMMDYMRKIRKPCFVWRTDTVDMFDMFEGVN